MSRYVWVFCNLISHYSIYEANLNKAKTGICFFFFPYAQSYRWLRSWFPSSLSPYTTSSIYNANTFDSDLPLSWLSTLSAFPHSRGTNSNRALVFILPPQGLPIPNSTPILHRISFLVITITAIYQQLYKQLPISFFVGSPSLFYFSRTTLLPNNLHNIQRGKTTHLSMNGGLTLVGLAAEAVVGVKQGYESIAL